MEKITYPPLIAHLKEQSDVYNQLYNDAEIRYGTIDAGLLSSWVVQLVEPIVKATTKDSTDKVPEVFAALYSELLHLLGSKRGLIYEREYKDAWNLTLKIPQLMKESPLRIIQAINSALVSIRNYQPERVFYWIFLMNGSVKDCSSVEEFLNCGRFIAWLSGMAQLREKAKEIYPILSATLQKSIQKSFTTRINIADGVLHTWSGYKQPLFTGEVGGFIGLEGYFDSPPVVASIDNVVIASDKENTYVLFADTFGKVLLNGVSVTADEVRTNSSVEALKKFRAGKGANVTLPDDISSCVLLDNTFILTRNSSHYLYVFGWC